MLGKQDYEKTGLKNDMQVKAGDPVYKLITNDKWTVVILLDDETARDMSETKRIKVRFAKDNETAFADFEVYNTPKANLGFLTFDTGMIRIDPGRCDRA